MAGKIVQMVEELSTSHHGLPALTSGDLDQMERKKRKYWCGRFELKVRKIMHKNELFKNISFSAEVTVKRFLHCPVR